MEALAGTSRGHRLERYLGSDVIDEAQTESMRRRSGFKQNGKIKRSPVKQRAQAAKAFVHEFTHNQSAIKAIQRARQRLAKLAAGERAMVASFIDPSLAQPSVTPVDQISSDGLKEGGNACGIEDDGRAECNGRAEVEPNQAEMSGSMSVDKMSYDGEDVMPSVVVAASCQSDNDPKTDSDYLMDSMDCQPDLSSTVFDPFVHVKKQQQQGPTERNRTDAKHWLALLPRLRKPYLALAEQRHHTVRSSLIMDDVVHSECNLACTAAAITVDCLFLEGKSSV
jgi:hypothetical protein